MPTSTATPTPEIKVYVVQAGDTLAAIARSYGTTIDALARLNGLDDRNLIRPGQRLIIP